VAQRALQPLTTKTTSMITLCPVIIVDLHTTCAVRDEMERGNTEGLHVVETSTPVVPFRPLRRSESVAADVASNGLASVALSVARHARVTRGNGEITGETDAARNMEHKQKIDKLSEVIAGQSYQCMGLAKCLPVGKCAFSSSITQHDRGRKWYASKVAFSTLIVCTPPYDCPAVYVTPL